MAVKSRSRSRFWTGLHSLIRFLGLNGLIAVAVGAFLWQALGHDEAGMIVMIAGASTVALALLAEVRGLARGVISQRGAAGVNVFVQIVLATALVLGANYFAFEHPLRFDLNADRHFTLDAKFRNQLAKLRGDTDIIVYLQHVSFGQRIDLRQDEYDQAAEKKIIRKVEDLADQFQEIGPRFRVHVMDTQKKNYKDKRKAINALSGELTDEQLKSNDNPTKDKPALDSELLKTVEKAPEDSIFFYTRDTKQLQRLSFNDIYQLDKKASEEANDKKGNLVLIDQGVEKFANKIFNIDEKKPRVGFAVVHQWLGQDGREEYGMPGLKTALAARDFESRDIVLWKRLQRDPGALEASESRYELLEAKKNHYERVIKQSEEELKDVTEAKDFWTKNEAEAVNKDRVLVLTVQGFQPITRKQLEAFRKAQGRIPPTRDITESYRQDVLKDLAESLEELQSDIESGKKKVAKANEEQSKLRVENLAEQRRITDVRVKFNRLLADIDLLVVPRATLFNVIQRKMIPAEVYPMNPAHIEAIKDFMKSGKPVLFCLGPMVNDPEDGPFDSSKDSLEKLLAEFNIQFPNQAVLYASEGDALAEIEDREQPPGGGLVDIPAAEFEWKFPPGARALGQIDVKASPPIRTSMRMMVHGLGERSREGLKLRHPRPVYVVPNTWPAGTVAQGVASLSLGWPAGPSQALSTFATGINKKFDEKAVFLMTDPDSWNEERPLATDKWTPHFERPKADDPHKGTVQEKRRGPFPIGVALESNVPADWYEKDATKKPTKVRLAVIGHGGLFIGDKLSPMREKLFLDVSNWLLGRENLLARESTTWEYPRVQIDAQTKTLWEWGARLGLPLLFIYFGLTVGLVRRMR